MPLRLATYNLENFGLEGPDAAPFEARAAALRPVLEALAADVLCLQEVNSQKLPGKPRDLAALKHLLQGTRYADYHLVHSHPSGHDHPADIHNLVILSRHRMRQHRSVWHDYVPPVKWTPLDAASGPNELSFRWDRPILQACLELPSGEALQVLNLHLRAPRAVFLPGGKQAGQWHSTAAWAEAYWLAAQKRQGQALEARLAVEALFDAEPDARIVVCGDLNADAYEMPTRILQALPEDMDTQAHAARALVPLERRVPEAARYSVLHDGRHVLLDHILASQVLAQRCRSVEIRNLDLMDEARTHAPVAGSLHAPMVAVFEDPG